MWNLLCQYNNIYAGSYKYFLKKVQTEDWRKKKKKKKNVANVAIMPLEQTKGTVVFIHSPNKCHNICTKHLFSSCGWLQLYIRYYFILIYKKLTS